MSEFTHATFTFDTDLNNVIGKIGSNSCDKPSHIHNLIPISDISDTPYEFVDQDDFDAFKASAMLSIYDNK